MVQTPTNIARDVKKYFLKIPHDIGRYLREKSRKSIFCEKILLSTGFRANWPKRPNPEF